MPGYLRSGEIVRWDKTESNEWLYASTDREVATILGLASAAEKKWHTERFSHVGSTLFFQFDAQTDVKFEDLLGLELFVYHIEPKQEHEWLKNNNLHNKIQTEWKTKKTIDSFKSVSEVKVSELIKSYHVYINNQPVHKNRAVFLNW